MGNVGSPTVVASRQARWSVLTQLGSSFHWPRMTAAGWSRYTYHTPSMSLNSPAALALSFGSMMVWAALRPTHTTTRHWVNDSSHGPQWACLQ